MDGFFLTHYDFVVRLEESSQFPPGPTGLQALPDMFARLTRAPVVSIASIRGRATGVGSELALASDMRFASREKAILSHHDDNDDDDHGAAVAQQCTAGADREEHQPDRRKRLHTPSRRPSCTDSSSRPTSGDQRRQLARRWCLTSAAANSNDVTRL